MTSKTIGLGANFLTASLRLERPGVRVAPQGILHHEAEVRLFEHRDGVHLKLLFKVFLSLSLFYVYLSILYLFIYIYIFIYVPSLYQNAY